MQGRQLAGLLLLLLSGQCLALSLDEHVESPRWNDRYDDIFQRYSKHYFGAGFDWRWFKAQAIAESTLQPDARSRTGAVGLMQVLPSTFREIKKVNPHFEDLRSEQWNIAAGIYYDYYLYNHKVWRSLAEKERLMVAFASYNVGLGGALKAYHEAPPPVVKWEHMAPFAPKSARDYVLRIVNIMTGGITRNKARRPPSERGFSARSRRRFED